MQLMGSNPGSFMEDYLAVLKTQFEASEDSFLLNLRCGNEWDKEAFSRLIAAMQICCAVNENSISLERWLAEGFWFLQTFVRGHTMQPGFPRLYQEEYYEKALQRLDDLAYWFFMGESPYLENEGFEPL